MFNHAYYQGILLLIGKYRNMRTFIPQQDKNKKFYNGQRLQELSTLMEQPPYSFPHTVRAVLPLMRYGSTRVICHILFSR